MAQVEYSNTLNYTDSSMNKAGTKVTATSNTNNVASLVSNVNSAELTQCLPGCQPQEVLQYVLLRRRCQYLVILTPVNHQDAR